MKKLIASLLLIAAIDATPLLELKAGYYGFSDTHLREIYGKGALDIGGSFAFPIWGPFNCYGSAEWIYKKSKIRTRPERIEISIVPICLGIQYEYRISSSIDWYLSLGPTFFFYHQRHHRPTIANRLDKNGFGGFANTGLLFYFTPHFALDFFAEYFYRKVRYQKLEIDAIFLRQFPGLEIEIGGLAVGAGLGYDF